MQSEVTYPFMPLANTLCIDFRSGHGVLDFSRKREGGDRDQNAFECFAGLAEAVEEVDRLVERRRKRLCSFKQAGCCSRISAK
jgi:hypothetical protein